jgi:nucleotide sugar dehydrogenase
MNVAVVGLGKVGLVLAAQYASRGLNVTGCDIDEAKVAQINAGRSTVAGETGLDEALAAAVASGSLRATADTAEGVTHAEVIVIITKVALDPNHNVDFSQFDAALSDIARGLRSGALVVVETTVPVGTTRHRVGDALAAPGREVLLAASPERVSSGRIMRDLGAYPKVIGPIDEASWERAREFYSAALPDGTSLLRVRDPETAELSKIAEGVYRDVNIALANELARYADSQGIDAREAFAAANSQPYSHIHDPGIGVGGHCVPVYPHFLPHDKARSLAAAARQTNDAMASYAIERLEQAMGSLRDAAVLILGVAYRPNVKEAANSSAILVADALRARGARVIAHDPLFTDQEIRALALEPPDAFPLSVDAIVVQAWHDAYRDIDLRSFGGCRAVLDGRAALDPATVAAADMAYVGVGR